MSGYKPPKHVKDLFIRNPPDDQLSLAIGKSGQNARLAAKLTNWKIDIKSESQFRQILAEAQNAEIEDADDEEIETNSEE